MDNSPGPRWNAKHLGSAKPAGLQLDAATLKKLKDQALAKARKLQEQAAKQTAQNYAHAKLAIQDVASSRDAREAGAKVWTIWKNAEGGSIVLAIARLLVCLYFINLVVEDYQHWAFMQTPEMVERRKFYPHRMPAARFPYLGLFVFIPAAVLAAAGVQVPVTATIMTLDMIYNSSSLIWSQFLMLLQYGTRPNELTVKKLAMLGCVALVLAHSVKDMKEQLQNNAYAGLLLGGNQKKEPGVRKSLVLLFGRLLMTLLFLYVGWVQMHRVIMRDWALWSKVENDGVWRKDGHDNNWLLLEFLLSLPFAVGFKTALVSRLLALTLSLEAFTCWPFWVDWPSWQYTAHVRLHFVTNLGVAGGLILLQNFGAGRYTVDQLMKKKGT
ncbi:probable surfeit locus protein 4 homolog at C-terminar half [Coccomyxa sp. Obi]|nr:probable surfeit locus protein 4 homolog at C-terminar half [Coccomyxa sp. Obi]